MSHEDCCPKHGCVHQTANCPGLGVVRLQPCPTGREKREACGRTGPGKLASKVLRKSITLRPVDGLKLLFTGTELRSHCAAKATHYEATSPAMARWFRELGAHLREERYRLSLEDLDRLEMWT